MRLLCQADDAAAAAHDAGGRPRDITQGRALVAARAAGSSDTICRLAPRLGAVENPISISFGGVTVTRGYLFDVHNEAGMMPGRIARGDMPSVQDERVSPCVL